MCVCGRPLGEGAVVVVVGCRPLAWLKSGSGREEKCDLLNVIFAMASVVSMKSSSFKLHRCVDDRTSHEDGPL